MNEDKVRRAMEKAAEAAIEKAGELMDTADCDKLTAGVAAAIRRALEDNLKP